MSCMADVHEVQEANNKSKFHRQIKTNLDVRVWFCVQIQLLDYSIFSTISEILIFNEEKQLFLWFALCCFCCLFRFAIDFYTHSCHALTLALARLSCTMHFVRWGEFSCKGRFFRRKCRPLAILFYQGGNILRGEAIL